MEPVITHATGLQTPGTFNYSNHATVRVTSPAGNEAQETSITGVRTFEFVFTTPLVVSSDDAIGITLENLVDGQSANVTAVRWSSTRDSWLNTVYPVSDSSTTGQSAEQVRSLIGASVRFNDDGLASTGDGTIGLALYPQKVMLFMGIPGASGTTTNNVAGATRAFNTFTTAGTDYYFIEGVEIDTTTDPANPVFASTATSAGVWTTDDPMTATITVANSANLVG